MPNTAFYTLLQIPKDVYYNENKRGMYGDMQLISNIFGQFDSSNGKPFLYRKEIRTSCVEFIIRSDNNPKDNPVELHPKFRMITKEVPESFFDRDQARVKVTLNPIVQKAGSGNSKKVPLKSAGDIRSYVNRIFQRNGIEPISLDIGKPINDVGFKKGHKITVSKVDVEGIVKVLDKESFKDSVRSGIGSAKRFGCGLVLVK